MMTLLTEGDSRPFLVGIEGGATHNPIVAALDLPYEDMRWCDTCDCEQRFVAVLESADGRWGFCSGCGAESFVRFTRTTAEVA